MLFSFTSRIVSALAAFLYPGYASYKALSQRPASEAELERWLMYWSVLGCIVGVEYLAEWLVSWIPLYTTMKAIFLLYLALPQTQGATYVYIAHLRPFFERHEQQIDVAILEVRLRVYRFLQEKARAIWTALISALAPGGANPNAYNAGQPQPNSPNANANVNQTSGPAQLLSSLWTSYGPGIVAGGAALLRQTAGATLPGMGTTPSNNSDVGSKPSAFNTPPTPFFTNSQPIDLAAKRRQLEAELASLPPISSGSATSSVPIPPANNPAVSLGPNTNTIPSSSNSSSSSLGGLRGRTMSSGKFEEIKGGDVEGYVVDDDFADGSHQLKTSGSGNKPAGWFGGWGSSSSGRGGDNDRGVYERVKSQ